jgi:hypothetical protein
MDIQEISTTDYFYSLIKDIRNQKSSFRCAFKDCQGVKGAIDWTLCIRCRKYFHKIHDNFIPNNDFEYSECKICDF